MVGLEFNIGEYDKNDPQPLAPLTLEGVKKKYGYMGYVRTRGLESLRPVTQHEGGGGYFETLSALECHISVQLGNILGGELVKGCFLPHRISSLRHSFYKRFSKCCV